MTSDLSQSDLDLIERSVPIINAAPEKFARRFYSRLFRVAPETRSLFPDDMTELRGKFVDELAFLSEAASNLDVFVERAHSLGQRHRDYGVEASHYDMLETVLLGTLAEAAGASWNPELRDAWRSLYRHLSAVMQQAATHA